MLYTFSVTIPRVEFFSNGESYSRMNTLTKMGKVALSIDNDNNKTFVSFLPGF